MRKRYSSRLWQCPFFDRDERQAVHCEGGAVVTFEDRGTYLNYASRYCCEAWESCTIAQALNEFYDTHPDAETGGWPEFPVPETEQMTLWEDEE